jgi:hypothetical protein
MTSRGFNQAPAGLAMPAIIVVLALVLSGCSNAASRPEQAPTISEPAFATTTTTTSSVVTESMSAGASLSEDAAITAARAFLEEKDAPVWATMEGAFSDVYATLSHRPTYVEQPAPAEVDPNRAVWGVEFQVGVDVCPPAPHDCEQRDGLVAILVDAETGEWVRSTTFAPSPVDPLPKP